MPDFLHWLLHSTAGLALRVGAGVAILASLAIAGYRRNRQQATRWREYLVLLICVAGATVYGILNDQITCAISWEYFYYGKELWAALGPATPPGPLRLHLAAAIVGAKATWTAGLIIGVGLLLANNPPRRFPQLPRARLLRQLPLILLVTLSVAALGSVAGFAGLLTPLSADFGEMVRTHLWRPRRFMAVYGIHLGGYIGGALGLALAAVRIRLERIRLA